MYELFKAVLIFTPWVSAVIVFVLLLRRFMGKKISSGFFRAAWLVLALRLVLPFNISLPNAPVQIELAPLPARQSAVGDYTLAPPPLQNYEAGSPAPAPVNAADNIDIAENPSVNPNKETNLNNPAPKIPLISLADITAALPAIWALGAVASLALSALSYAVFTRRLKKGAMLQSGTSLHAELDGKLNVYTSRFAKAPVLCGFIKPALYVPFAEYTQKEAQSIARHELLHHKRRDLWLQLMLLVAVSVSWFNPLVYLMRKYALMDIEMSVDETLLKDADLSRRREYGEMLLGSLKQGVAASRLTAGYASGKSVKQRFKALLSTGRKKSGKIILAFICAVCVLVSLLVSCVTKPESSAKSPAQSLPQSAPNADGQNGNGQNTDGAKAVTSSGTEAQVLQYFMESIHSEQFAKGDKYLYEYEILDIKNNGTEKKIYLHTVSKWVDKDGGDVSGGAGLYSVTLKESTEKKSSEMIRIKNFDYSEFKSYPKPDDFSDEEIPKEIKETVRTADYFQKMKTALSEKAKKYAQSLKLDGAAVIMPNSEDYLAFRLPLKSYTHVSGGVRLGHEGLDIAAEYGTEIYAAAAGKVKIAQMGEGEVAWKYGLYVEIEHENGLLTRYAHMQDIMVAAGDEVVEGALLGHVGLTGRTSGPHLHFEARINNEAQVLEVAEPQESGEQSEITKTVWPFDDIRPEVYGTKVISAREYNPSDIVNYTFNNDVILSGAEAIKSKVMENGKNPGLNVRALHEQGITGKGVNVAIIDQNLVLSHPEFNGKIVKYFDTGCEQPAHTGSMHAPAVTSLLVGSNIGTAPGARVYFAAVPSWKGDSDYYAKALDWIIEENKKLPENNKIRVVSVSAAPADLSQFKNVTEWNKAKERAEAEGLLVLDCDYETGIISPVYFNPEAPDDILQCKGWFPDSRKSEPMNTEGQIGVPASFRTVAEQYYEDSPSYQYTAKGGLSWAIPYAAGVMAMGWQVNPALSGDEMVKIMLETCAKSSDGSTVINPTAFIEAVKKTV